MTTTDFIDNAKVMAKGQVTIPRDIRRILGIETGDRVTFVVENGTVRLVNTAVYAMQIFQKNMAGQAQNAGIDGEEDIMKLVAEEKTEL